MQADNIKACLVHTIDTSRWALNGSPAPSTDPSAITLLSNGHLLIPDSEVEESPAYNFHGFNLYEADRSGTLLSTGSTLVYTQEPTGAGINPSNNHLFFSDDDRHEVFELNPGPDGKYGTRDDSVTSFSTSALDSSTGRFDPEGVAYGLGDLFVVSAGKPGGEGTTDVYQIAPGGPNGTFNGLPAVGGNDVVVNHFVTNAPSLGVGVPDPEGIAYNPDHNKPDGSLYIIGRGKQLIETTPDGALLNTIDITPIGDLCFPSDVVQAPGSLNPTVQHLYIPDRGVDNGVDPYENDGKVHEISLDPTECALLPQNLLLNSGFELDCNNTTYPTRWSYKNTDLNSTDATFPRDFTRSNEAVHSGKYAGKHFATDNWSYNVTQTITGLSGGTTYNFSGWVNIPPATFTNASLELQVKWTTSSGNSTTSIKTYTTPTGGWEPVVAILGAPAGTTKADVRMVVTNLNATIYVDDFVFSSSVAPVLDGFTPDSGQIGDTAIIGGSHFMGATAVTFNGVAATFTVDSDTQIRAAVPSGATNGPLSVSTAVGTGVSGSDFFIVTNPVTVPPAITAFTPSSGPVGTELTISGSHFAGATEVKVNSTPAITVTVDSDTQVRAVVADGTTGTGPISVTTPAGTGASSNLFTVTVPPVITAFTPDSSQIGGTVILTGSNFTGATAVAFNGTTQATSFHVDSDTQISAIVPKTSAGVSDSGFIFVTTPTGTGVSPGKFTVFSNVGLLANYGFELATNTINPDSPDSWTLNPHFTRSNEVVAHGGSFVGRHSATDGSSYTVSQTVLSLAAGKQYSFSGWVNIPSIGGSFRLDLKVVWRNSLQNRILNTQTIKSYKSATSGWVEATANLTAPSGTDSAQVQMVLTGLKRTLYVDDFVLNLVQVPTISSFTPSSGKVGTAVTITGSHFTGATAVAFNGKAASFVVDSDFQIRATVPNRATTGSIKVTNAAGTGTSATNFTVTK